MKQLRRSIDSDVREIESVCGISTSHCVSVRAHGIATLVKNTEKIMELLDATIDSYDTAYKKQWDNLPEEYVEELLNRIVVFEVEVTDLLLPLIKSNQADDHEPVSTPR